MKLKLKKYPKKPKASASIEVKQAYLKKVSAINAENRARVAEHKRSQELSKQISKIGSHLAGIGSVSRKAKASAKPRKPRKKRGSRKRRK